MTDVTAPVTNTTPQPPWDAESAAIIGVPMTPPRFPPVFRTAVAAIESLGASRMVSPQ